MKPRLLRRPLVRRILSLGAWLATVVTGSAALEGEAALTSVTARLTRHYAAGGGPASGLSAESLLTGLAADGRWPDLEAAFRPAQAGYARFGHFLRVQELAVAFHGESDPARRAIWAEAIHRALAVWLGRDAPASPGWQKQIGSPKYLARAAILFAPELTATERAQTVAILQTCVRPDGTLDYAGLPATGANLIDQAEIQIVAGCLLRDSAMIARYARVAETELGPGREEGVQADASFHQHGPQLYSGGYGAGFARDAAALASALRDTGFAFSPATIESLLRYVLDGIQRMTRGPTLDFLTVGRQISRPGLGTGDALTAALDSLLPIAGPRTDEVRAFAARLRGAAPPETAPARTAVFWNSDYVTHSRPGFFASARLSSRRIQGYECGNGENELGYHLGDGAMTLMVTGREYRDIFPLWDWRRVPGVSCVVNPAVPFPRHTWGRGAEGFSDFAGGVSDGDTGAAAMELHRGGLHARKAWFFLADSVVCLGTGLLPDDPALPVVTSIDQRWADGAVTSSSDAAALPAGETRMLRGPGWVHHGGVTYLFPAGGEFRVRTEHKSAAWSVINQSVSRRTLKNPSVPEPKVEGDVFSLWIDHGARIDRGADYAYIVAPGLTPVEIDGFAAPRVLLNTPALQAITATDVVQAVFWRPGSLTLPDGRRLEADQPCIVQLRRESATGRWWLAAGNPTQRVRRLVVTLRPAGPTSPGVETRFDFPADAFAGRPQIKPLSLD